MIGDTNANVSLEKIYPVGSIYMNASNSTNPAEIFGFGTWQALDEGRVLIGANTTYSAGSKGGEASHTLSVSEIPSHSHELNQWDWIASRGFNTGKYSLSYISANNGNADTYNDLDKSLERRYSVNTGGGGSHNNMQPYLSVYMWVRTA